MEGVIARPRPVMMKGHNAAERKGEVIHSGHFMISSVADQDEIDDDVSHDRDSPLHHEEVIRLREGYDFSEVRKETQNTYQFGHRSTNQITIDASLSRLFECMSLAYRGGKVVSPKWKNFKGMRLTVKDKIRLNNAIWRTWHIQYIMKKKRNKISFVQFATPLDNESDCDSHSKPEAVVMEGKYWKRRIETVVAEYKKWRAFFMEKLQQSDHPGLTWVSNQSAPPTPENIHNSLDAIMKADDTTFADLADKLFSRLSQPFQFPNPREIAQHATNSDMMQPGLLQLQPPIDDFMDPLDTLQDIFCPTRRLPLNGTNSINSLFYSGNTQSSTVAQLDFPTPMITQQDFQAAGMQESTLEELVQKATAGFDPPIITIAEEVPRFSARQQDPQMQVQQTNNFGVSDAMLGKASAELIFPPLHPNNASTKVSVMASKQQQESATISQVGRPVSNQHHQHGLLPATCVGNQQAKVQTANRMPPPQKAPPRRKSLHKTHNNVHTPATSTIQTSAVQPTVNNITDVRMAVECPPQAQITNSNHIQVAQVYPVTVTPVVTPHLENHSIPQPQLVQMQVDKPVPQMSISVVAPQTPAPNVCIENVNLRPVNTPANKEASARTATTLIIPVTAQEAVSNTYMRSCDQPPQKKSLLVNPTASPEIVVKQPSSTILNSQHISAKQQTLLTQLLTSGRSDGKSQSLQLPSNMMLSPAVREAQLKQVREQAANFNTFQNSVVIAAAQMAMSPQLPQINSQTGNSNSINTGTATNLNSAARNEVSAKPFISFPTLSPKESAIRTPQDLKAPWGPMSQTQVVTMDTDEGIKDGRVGPKDDFLNQMEEKSYSASPASSSSSTCGEQRPHHFTAEQKRRCNIKSLCDRLQEILPDTANHPNPKVSKAVLLSKSCQYIRQLQSTRQNTTAEIQKLKKKIEGLNEDISNFQQQLPATGAPVSRHRGDKMKAIFDEWVRDRTLTDWKFFIFSMIIRPWFMSYDETVSNSNLEELCRTCLMWLEKHCSMLDLRRGVVNSLQELGTTTSILTDPTTLQQQAESAVKQRSRRSSSSS